MSSEENVEIDNELISMDGPLLIVLDEDDYEEEEEEGEFDITTTTTTTTSNISVNHTEEQTIISNDLLPTGGQSNIAVKNLVESLSIETNTKSKVFRRSSKSSNQLQKSTKSIRTVVIDTSFTQQRRRMRSKSKCKNPSPSNNLSIDSALSYISFDEVSNILTVARMGSIYYCVEDLYIKIYSSLCTLDEFSNLLIKPQILILKQVTLSEKISITEQNSKLKKFSHIRYRLISIDSSDYLIKLKHLLTTNKNKQIERIIDKMRGYKQTSTSILLHNKVSKKRVSTDDVKQQKRLKSVTDNQKLTESTQLEMFIPCNDCVSCDVYSKNETISSNNNSIECSLNKSEICPTSSTENISAHNSPSTAISLCGLHRSESLIYNQEEIQKHSPRSCSLPSMKFDIKENTMMNVEPNIVESMDDDCSMPMIVNVEENVQVDNQEIGSSEPSLLYAQTPLPPPPQSSLDNSISPSAPVPYLYLYQTSSSHLTPIQTPYDLYHRESQLPSPLSQKCQESFSNHQSKTISSPESSSNIPVPIVMSILEELHNQQPSSFEQQTSTVPCYAPSCSPQSITNHLSATKNILLHERMTYQKQHRIPLTPYPPTKTYFAPLSNHCPSQSSLMNETTPRATVHCPKSPVYVKNCPAIISPPNTPNGSRLACNCTRSIDLSQAIIEHNQCNMDQIPKLVVRHTKTYSTKTIDTMGQLFPSWFNEPSYRCILCFSCDQVFTPQLFMTHVDDEEMINKQPLNMTSIQLLTSEKMSEYKVELWNEFCTNLTAYTSKYDEVEKKTNSSEGGSHCRISNQQTTLRNKNQEKNCSTVAAPVMSILTVNELM